MIKKYNSDYVTIVTQRIKDKYDIDLTEKQVEKIINYFTKNIVKSMFLTRDVNVRGFLKLQYSKAAVALYHANCRK